MALFTGTHINRVDRKGRVSVPASFRATLLKESASEIAVFPSFAGKSLEACSVAVMESLADGFFADHNFFGANQGNLSGRLFEVTEQLEWDPEGRVILPAKFISHSGIAEQAMFVGRGRYFQIWEPEAFKAHRAAEDRQMAENPELKLFGQGRP